MRKILLLLPALLLAGVGCQTAPDCTRCGCGLWFYKPPVLQQNTLTLLNPSAGQTGAIPTGSLFGPVSAGQATHAPVHVPAMPPIPSAAPATKASMGLTMPIGPSYITPKDACNLIEFGRKCGPCNEE